MPAEALTQGILGSRSLPWLQNVRSASFRNAVHPSGSFAPPQPLHLGSTSHFRRTSDLQSAKRENFTEVDDQIIFRVPSILKLPIQSKEASAATNLQDTSAVQESSNGLAELPTIGTVREVFQAATKAVEDAPIQSVGKVALYGGMAAFGFLVSGAVLNSVDHFPLAPETLQTIGALYSIFVASQVVQKKPISFPPPSPFKAVIELVASGQSDAESFSLNVQEDMNEGAAAMLAKLARERDAAVDQAEELRRAAEKTASVVAEKDALEAVSLQLADERDGAMSEVLALNDAIVAMTNRIKAIEEMLEQEVSQLKQQNQALETVSLQLASERDAAVQEIEQLRSLPVADSWMGEKEALEIVAIELAQERDTACAEVEELKKVVAILREATATSSGLTSEQEVFIKARVREIRSQFIDLEHVYEEQKDKVDTFIEHLVQEYGAPNDWAADYVKQFLKSSASKLSPPKLNVGLSQVESLAAKTSRNS